MAHCSRCGKFMLFTSGNGLCKECDITVQEEKRRKMEIERERQKEEQQKAEQERIRAEEEARKKAEEERRILEEKERIRKREEQLRHERRKSFGRNKINVRFVRTFARRTFPKKTRTNCAGT